MGLRLSFGVGPLRASVPLTSRRRRRRRRSTSARRPAAQAYHAVVKLPDGSVYTCHHQHRTQQAATECAQKYQRSVAAGKPDPSARSPERKPGRLPPPPRDEPTVMTGYPPDHHGWAPPPAAPPPRKNWFARHKVRTVILGLAGAFVVLTVITAIAGPPKTKPTASAGVLPAPTKAASSPAPTPTTSPPPPPLTSTASVIRSHPRTGTKVGVQVSTAPGARITAIAHFEAGDLKKTARADSTGWHTFWFPLGSAPPGIRVLVTVRVSAHGRKRLTRVWFTPHQPPPPPAPKNTAAPAAQPSGCFPKASTGNCYEPGEFCADADAGMSGVAGDGKAIICRNNDGLRWEPA